MKAAYLMFFLVLFSLPNCNGKDIDSPGPAVIMGTIESHDPDDDLSYFTYLTSHPVKIIGSLTIFAKSGAKGKDPEFKMQEI